MKHVNPCSQGVRKLRCAVLCAAAAVSFAAHAKDLTFEQAFSTKGESAATHFQATFVTQGGEHRLEVWRDGERRIKRRSDDAAESYAVRQAGSPEFRLSILDLKKKIHTDIDRSNLYRIGNFTDWFDLGHGMRHPKGNYRLVHADAPDGAVTSIAPCNWFDLIQDAHVTHICWSAKNRLPLLMLADDGRVLWRITHVDHQPISARTFEIHDEGFVRNDANEDIERD